jgi:hypothetical protein
MDKATQNQFETIAREKARTNMALEFLGFLKHNKKWWLLPILVVLLLFGILIVLSGTAAAPFIYTLF